MRNISIKRFQNGALADFSDVVVEERLLNLFVEDEHIASITYSNGNETQLVVGYLFTEGFISAFGDLKEMKFAEKGQTTACYVRISDSESKRCVATSKIEPERVFSLLGEVLSKSETFKLTGSTHISGVADDRKVLFWHEDISRKSSIQKCAGDLLVKGLSPSLLLTSGRVVLYTVQYAARMGIGIVVSRSAVSDLAVKEAESSGITVIGFVRGNRFNVYTHPERLK